MGKADLHVHTIMSDGMHTLDELIKMCKSRGVTTMAITDHDTTKALKNKPFSNDVNIINGIELSTTFDNKSVHILGYFIDETNDNLNKKLKFLREKRKDRAKKIVEKLKVIEGIDLDYEEIKKKNPNSAIGRVHIAKELVEKNYVDNISSAFEKYIGDDCPCFVRNEKLTIKEAVDLINNAGGISFLAHPGLIKDIEDYDEILKNGIEGIEVFYPKHSEQQRQFFYDLAIKHNLLISGGSDFHGLKMKGKNKLASAYLTDKYLNQIINYHNNKI